MFHDNYEFHVEVLDSMSLLSNETVLFFLKDHESIAKSV